MRELPRIDMHDVISEGPYEIHIVTDEHQGPLELIKRVGQRIDAGHIQMRGGFIHEQQIRRIQEKLDQGQAAFLSSAQHTDLFKNIIATKQEGAQQSAHELFGDPLGCVKGLIENRARRVKHVHTVLRIIT